MDISISMGSLITQGIVGAVLLVMPFAMWFIWRKKTSAPWLPLIAGVVGYLIIGLVRGLSRLAQLSGMQNEPWKYYILQALMAGIFEEFGRYLIFRYALPDCDEYRDAVSAGIGHGGTEFFIVTNIGADADGLLISNFIVGLIYMIWGTSPFISSGLTMEETVEYIGAIASTGIVQCIMLALTSAASMVFHISMSVLVFTSAKLASDKKLLYAAVGIHTVADIIPALHFAGGMDRKGAEIIEMLFAAAAAYFAFRVYEEYRDA